MRGEEFWRGVEKEGLFGKLSDRAIAKRVGCDKSTVAKWRTRFGIPAFKQKNDWSPERVDYWRQVAADGLFRLSNRALAKELGFAEPTIARWRARVGAKSEGPWTTWPEGAIAEIEEVIRRNDLNEDGWRYIPPRKMAERLREAWEVIATTESLLRFCKKVIGRHSWRIP